MKNQILTKVIKALSLLKDPTFSPTSSIRFNDLTEITDDPGNTCLFTVHLPFSEDPDFIQPTPKQLGHLLTALLQQFDSEGDYSEEILIITQNAEAIIILNFNK